MLSYVSNDSFFENKHGFSEQLLTSNVPTFILQNQNGIIYIPQKCYKKLVSCLLNEKDCMFNIQVRGFKTDRSVKAESQRNPSLVTRIKNAFGLSQNYQTEPKIVPNPANAEKLKQMLGNEESLTDSEKQKVKIAFAEGYLLGNNSNNKVGRVQKYFKVLSQTITALIILAIIVSLLGSVTGTFFR